MKLANIIYDAMIANIILFESVLLITSFGFVYVKSKK